MPKIEIPNPKTRRWTGCYLGEYNGNLQRTFNIDLENKPGEITISRSFERIMDTVSDTNLVNLGIVDAFERIKVNGRERWWAMCRNGRLFVRDTGTSPLLLTGNWLQDGVYLGDCNSPFDAQDMAIGEKDSDSGSDGEDIIFITRDTAVATHNDCGTNTWVRNSYFHTTPTALQGGITGMRHPIAYFPTRRIYVIGDGNKIHTIDKNKNSSYARLTLPSDYRVWHIFVTTYRVWILCSGTRGNNGAIVEWDGSSETYNNIYDAKSEFPLSGVNYNEIPIVVNNKGMILEYNGFNFSVMIRNGHEIFFPFSDEFGNAFSLATSQMPISPKGMTVSDDGLIYILANSPSKNSFKSLGGVWCLNPETGNLYSKYTLGPASTPSDSDYGQQIMDAPGAIKAVNIGQTFSNSSYLVASASINLDGVGSTKYGVWHLPREYSKTIRKGWFVTEYFHADDIQEMWETIWLKHGLMKTTNSEIIVKAKGVQSMLDVDRHPIQKTITWTSITTFTVTLGAGDDALAIGDEVEIVGAVNSGQLAHITDISGAHAALQTITIDETMDLGSGTSYARFDRWKKLAVIDSQTKYFTPVNIGITSSFIQFKVELRGPATDFHLKEIISTFKPQTIK